MIVVDASVVVDFLIGRPAAVDALLDAMHEREHEPLHAPELIDPETLNALRRLAASGAVSDERATDAVTMLDQLRLIRYPHAGLRPRVWALRHELTAYDATYLALAEALDDPLLITCDAALASRAGASLGDTGVRLVD